MEDISNINFENENRPILDNHKVNCDDILNGSAENKLSATESVVFLHGSPLNEKQVLTSVNNNFQNEKPNTDYSSAEYSTAEVSNNSAENISCLLSEPKSTKAEDVNSSSLAYETSIITETSDNISSKSLENNSVFEDEFKAASDNKSVFSPNKISAGNINFLPDALSDDVLMDNQKNLSINATECNETEKHDSTSTGAEDEKNGSHVVPDLVDFSFRVQENATNDLLQSINDSEILSIQSVSASNDTVVKISDNPAVNNQDNKLLSMSAVLLETDFTNIVPKSPKNIHKESGITDSTENCADILENSFGNKSLLGVSENSLKEVSDATAFVDTSVEFEKPSLPGEEVYVIDSGKFDISTNNECKGNIDDMSFQMAENISGNEPDEVSPLKVEKVSLGMSDTSAEQFANPEFESEVSSNNLPEQFAEPGFEFKVPEVPPQNPFEELSDPDSAFKVPGVAPQNPCEQLSDPGSAFKVPEVPPQNPFEQLSDPNFAFKVPGDPSNSPREQFPDSALKMQEDALTSEDNEQFVDAAQFFRDPNSFQFLENIITSSTEPRSAIPRSSLFVNFDPLHSKFQGNVPRQDNCALITAALLENNALMENSEKCNTDALNKNLQNVSARESLGNILISFDSPKSVASADSKTLGQNATPPKLFTEEEVQQKLKIHELETQDAFLQKQREMEMQITKKDELIKIQQIVIEEVSGISAQFSEQVKNCQEKIASLEALNEKLTDDLKTSTEDQQSVENTFTDFYKRYEQCKGMLKTYKDNEEHLKQTILDLQTQAKEQEQMYNMLHERTEDMLEKANVEVENVKRSGEAQVTVLKAQLKKAEMKISSLESDIKQIKMENSELGGICDDLMAKVSRS